MLGRVDSVAEVDDAAAEPVLVVVVVEIDDAVDAVDPSRNATVSPTLQFGSENARTPRSSPSLYKRNR